MNSFFLIMIIAAFSFTAAAKAEEAPLLSEQDCQFIVSHVPNEDVDYKPAVDVHGKPVMEADLTPPLKIEPETYSFPVTIDMAAYLGIDVPHGIEGHMNIGVITMKGGQPYFNGEPLSGKEQEQLRALCVDDKKPSE